MLSKISRDLQILDNKLRFITEVIEQVLEIRNVPKLMICKINQKTSQAQKLTNKKVLQMYLVRTMTIY
jgi:hypothetical protein